MEIIKIYLYTNKHDSDNWILKNDWYFNLYTSNEDFTEAEKKVIKKIDNAVVNVEECGKNVLDLLFPMDNILESNCK